jgi:hypothetical protein
VVLFLSLPQCVLERLEVLLYEFQFARRQSIALSPGPEFKGTKKTLTRVLRINNSWNTESWEQMSAIKSRILRIWDVAPAPVRLSCIKFAQRVVLAQTASNGMEQKVGGLQFKLCERS